MLDFFKDLGGFIMKPLYFLISAVMLGFHRVFGNIFGERRAPPGRCRSSA